MKHVDLSFKFVALVIIAGVVVAFAAPNHAKLSAAAANPAAPQATHAMTGDASTPAVPTHPTE